MLDTLITMCRLFGTYYADIIPMVVIMVSAIIVLIGLLKPIYNKITNKNLRKVALSFSSVIACFGAAFIYFLVEGWNFKYYFLASIALSVVCIVTYWFYENTCLRNLIGVVGGLALRKALSVLKVAITEDDVNTVKAEIQNATAQLKSTTKQELKNTANKIKVDKDLKGL